MVSAYVHGASTRDIAPTRSAPSRIGRVVCASFAPDPRVGERQHVCQREECQAERHRRDQAEWYRRNPGYFIARRLGERAAESDPRTPRMPPPLGRLPWDLRKTSSVLAELAAARRIQEPRSPFL
jgi:hypothetical protein